MAVLRSRPKLVCVQGFAVRPGFLRPWAAAALSFVVLAPAGDEPLAYSAGCARCGAPATAPPVPTVRPTFVERKRRQERWTLKMSLRRETRNMAGDYTVCVRKCDGSFFPVSYVGAPRSDALQQVCRSLCPNADVALYSFPFGGTIDEAVSSTGEPYSHLANAHKFEQSYEQDCSCRAPGQSWAEALAAAEAIYGRHSSEIPISVEAAERMSRPTQDPTAKPAAADPAQIRAAPPVGLPTVVDVNGVDTALSAATAAISRGSSGIRDEDGEGVTSYDVKQGQTVEETIPDGSIRRVRVLPSNF